jgi:hypothetical protein
MSLSDQHITGLSRGSAYSFADWPNPSVPVFGAGVYTIWHNDDRFIYVGMSGRGITAETIRRNTPQGIYTRLRSHASGRRSGDQFCVYVADRLVLPTLTQKDIADIASGRRAANGSMAAPFSTRESDRLASFFKAAKSAVKIEVGRCPSTGSVTSTRIRFQSS